MFEKKSIVAVVAFITGVTLWIITNNVVFFIIGLSAFAVQKRVL